MLVVLELSNSDNAVSPCALTVPDVISTLKADLDQRRR